MDLLMTFLKTINSGSRQYLHIYCLYARRWIFTCSRGNSTISFDEKTKKIDTEKEVSKTEEFELYEEAVENQVTPEEN